MRSPPSIEPGDPFFLASLCATAIIAIISVWLIGKIPLSSSLFSRARLAGAVAILDLCEFLLFLKAIRSEPYFLISLAATVAFPTILFYAAALSLVVSIFKVLRGSFKISRICAFGVVGMMSIWVIKVAFTAAYASPAGCIMAGFYLIVNVAKSVAVHRVKDAHKAKAKSE